MGVSQYAVQGCRRIDGEACEGSKRANGICESISRMSPEVNACFGSQSGPFAFRSVYCAFCAVCVATPLQNSSYEISRSHSQHM